MEINLKDIVIIAGNYGSGKSEVAVSLAIHCKKAGTDVCIADLDLVNPYFRSREAKSLLSKQGINLVLPPAEYMYADLPILSPAVAGLIRNPAPLTILDAGGDDAGATVLGALAHVLKDQEVRMLQVVNPFRPFTDTAEGCMHIRQEIEAASKIKCKGLIGNANLIDDTCAADIREGYAFVKNLSEQSGLPLEFITAPSGLLPELAETEFACPVLPIRRQLVPPWKRAAVI
ncbi:MAG: cobalamin biosynthesis protein CbiA [Desulfococcaceae bacterium]|nr:cobalamin biosynthesis protein CbiA [Desulfococcaceae bacterium]